MKKKNWRDVGRIAAVGICHKLNDVLNSKGGSVRVRGQSIVQ